MQYNDEHRELHYEAQALTKLSSWNNSGQWIL